MEYRRFPPGESPVSTLAYHHDRERAPHLEQAAHTARLHMARDLVNRYYLWEQCTRSVRLRVVDLGCGDGGLLQLLRRQDGTDMQVEAAGYDFMPANPAGWVDRNVDATLMDFVADFDRVELADLYVMTEVLEHLEEPYAMVRSIRDRGAALVCSSPWIEHEGSIDGSHNWAWDMPGYIAMLEACGMQVLHSERVTWSQVHLAVPA